MREIYAKSAFLLTGAAHLLAFVGISGARQLEQFYGVALADDPALTLMIQHRAAFLGIIAALCIVAAWRKPLRGIARLVALASMASFVVLYLLGDAHSIYMDKVFWVDVVMSALLLATWLPARRHV